MRRKILIAAGWLAVWQLVSILVHNRILIAGPAETGAALLRLLPTASFWRSLLASFLRIAGGFAAGSILGILLSWLAYRKPLARQILAPFVTVMKAVPVASFVIILLIWSGNRNLSFYISMLVVFPVLYLNTLKGLDSTDVQLLEMAQVYRMPMLSRIRYIYFPEVSPFMAGGFLLALGMSWKSGVAAEVIGQPLVSVGNSLYRAKINLETADVFAWSVVIILASWAFEKLFMRVFALLAPGGGKVDH